MRSVLLILICGFSWCQTIAQPTIVFEQPINANQGGGIADLDAGDWFGYDMAPIGDLNGDGVNDIAVGAIYDGDGGTTRGAVYILFMTNSGTVGSYQKISDTQGGFQGVLVDEAFFGSSITNLGDINGDGVQDLAVGATGDDDGGSWAGSVWILFMNTDGTVNGEQKISALSGSFNAGLEAVDRFGVSLDSIGDLNNDGVNDLMVGAFEDDDSGLNRGAIYILYLNSDGTVQSFAKIHEATPGFTGDLSDNALFGWAVSYMGDMNGDGNIEILVGASQDNVAGFEEGSVWVISITNAGAIVQTTEISVGTSSLLTNILSGGDKFGSSVTLVHDLWCDSSPDIAVGLRFYGANAEGAVLLLDLDQAFDVVGVQVITEGQSNMQQDLDDLDLFGWGLDVMYDYNGDGFAELMVGAVNFDEGGSDTGGTWLFSLAPDPTPLLFLADTVLACNGDDVELGLNILLQNPLWSTGETTDSITVSSTGLVWVTGMMSNCLVSDTVLVEFTATPNVDLGADTTVCGELILETGYPGYEALWNTADTTSQIVVTQTGMYSVSLSGACGTFTDDVVVTVTSPPNVSLLADTVMACNGENVLLFPNVMLEDPLWETGETTDTISVGFGGQVWISGAIGGCMVSDTVWIELAQGPTLNFAADTMACGNLILEADYPEYDVLWSTGQTTDQIEITQSGIYSVTLTGACGSITSDIAVTIATQPIADFLTRSKPVEFLNPNVQFVNESFGASSYEWHFGDGDISYDENPEHAYDTSGIYLVMLITFGESGCIDTTYGYIEVDPFFTFYVPNAFTPDGDGLNDTWGAHGLNFEHESFELEIFDRWGGLMWRTDNPLTHLSL